MKPESGLAWHFVQPNGTLRDGQESVIGKTYKVDPPLVLCERGLHFSYRAIDALGYANSHMLTLVRVGGSMIVEGDKGCCSERTIIAGPVNAESTLREFARWCALQVIHLWNCPPIVKVYLETGKEELRDAAWAAARDAAWVAARDAAWDAAWDAARAAARDAARDAAGDVARAAAWAAEYDKYNDHLETILLAYMDYKLPDPMK